MAAKQPIVGDMTKCLVSEKFRGLCGELATWRMNQVITLMEQTKGKGRVLGFVKGLRFSARVAYLVRDIMSGKDVHVSWGHLVNEHGTSCSPECDIVIHRPGWLQKWNNGGKHPIMDFKFIKASEAIAVISCKSLTRVVDPDYCKDLMPYNITKVYLVCECCSPRATKRLSEQAKKAGYSGFHYLYEMEKGGSTFAVNETGILDFIAEMDALKALI